MIALNSLCKDFLDELLTNRYLCDILCIESYCGIDITISGWPKGLGPPRRGYSPPFFLSQDRKVTEMNDLSIFVDESGDFGPYEHHSPFYIVTLVFHEQNNDETANIIQFNKSLDEIGLPNHVVHAGPLIRREDFYENLSVDERMLIFRRTFNFMRKANITYKSFIVEKKHISGSIQQVSILSKLLAQFLTEFLDYFNRFDRLILYYDNGQTELTKILVSVFHALFHNVEQREAKPAAYRLQQVADVICTLELTAVKAEQNSLTRSEISFFKSARDLKKNFIKPLKLKVFRQ